jgi:hypothetical protein
MVSNTYNNFGLGMSLNLSPIQLYVVGDNLLGTAMVKDVNSFVSQTKFFNVRLGLNFVIGFDKKGQSNTNDYNLEYEGKKTKNYSPKKVRKKY